MATIKVNSNQFEDAAIITLEDGNVLEAVICHIPGSEPTFYLNTYDSIQGQEETYQTIYTCPVDAA